MTPLLVLPPIALLVLAGFSQAHADVVISEIMALTTPDDKNRDEGGTRDEDDHLSDWVELHNTGDEAVVLTDYALTDDKGNRRKFVLPSRFSIEPNGYRVVWCSMKNKSGLFATEFHANFKLERGGEYLALVSPDGEVLDEFDPYPNQYPNVTYGKEGYMTRPTPGAANAEALAAPTHEVDFSLSSRTFTGELVLELTSPDLPEGARIGYTTDGSLPKISLFSPPLWYDVTGPIVLDGTMAVRARVFEDGKLPGPVKTEHYFKVSAELAAWSSDLPVLVVESFNQRFTKARFSESAILFLTPQEEDDDLDPGRTSLIQEAALGSRMTARQRGSSTGAWPKKSLAMEMWFDDANWADRDIAPFGMPADADWILSGRYDFDRALMRNPLTYRFAREMGQWAPRTQFVEVFMNEDGDDVEAGDYVGVFTFMEKIEMHPDRVNLQDPTGQTDGGFMVKVDRLTGQSGTTDRTFTAAGQGFVWVEPEKEFVTTQQNTMLRDHFNRINETISDDAIAEDPVNGYRSLIDVDSWIDEYIIRTLTRDPDGFRLSTYLYMPRNGKVHYGPVWDFDRTMGCDSDARARDPEAWVDYFATYGWWAHLLGSGANRSTPTAARPEFLQDWIDRYQRHRRTVLDIDHMNAIIDEFAAQLAEGQVRNFQKWTAVRPDAGSVKDYNNGVTGWEGEIVHLKGWLKARVEWMDDHFVNPPGFDPPGGLVERGSTVKVLTGGTIFSPQTAYVTTDGTDPRKRGNEPGETAQIAPKTITVNETVNYSVRAEQGDRWSGPITTAFVVDGIPADKENFLVSEIMYHPPAGSAEEQAKGFFDEDSFEFIELVNAGDKDMYIGDVTFASGIQFPFSESAIQALAPGERIVLVSDREAFALRYGAGVPVGGEFVGKLANGGERLALMRGDEVIQDFTYGDGDPWPTTPDDYGHSLVLHHLRSGLDLANPREWTADASVGGSPGSAGQVAPTVFVTEVLANSGPGAVDAVELFNPAADPVDIGGWFLTDDEDEPDKYVFPEGTAVVGMGYLVVLQDNDGDPDNEFSPETFGESFGLASNGDGVFLFSADETGRLTGFQDGFRFGASGEGDTIGRYETSKGEVEYPVEDRPTLGGANAGPRVGPMVISEVMYHPGEDALPDAEFIEICNVGSDTVILAEAGNPDSAWRLNGADYRFPEGTILHPGEVLVIAGNEPDVFRSVFGVAESVRVLGPFEGRLSNGGETIRLQRPGTPYEGEQSGSIIIPYITVDEVDYDDRGPWPIEADGAGVSLERISLTAFGNDVSNWSASALAGGTPGALPDGAPDGDLTAWRERYFTDEELAEAMISGLAADPDGDGFPNVFEYAFNTDPKRATAAPAGKLSRVEIEGKGHIVLSYTRRRGAEVSMTLESSTDLVVWSPSDAIVEFQNLGGGLEKINFRDASGIGETKARYLRVRIDSR